MCFEDIKNFLAEKTASNIPENNFEDISIVSTLQ
jgi:hypothetical protein